MPAQHHNRHSKNKILCNTYEGMSGGGRAAPGLPEGTGGMPPPGRLGMAGAGLPPGGTPGGARPAPAAGAGGGCDLFIAGDGGENLQCENLSVSFGYFWRDRDEVNLAMEHALTICHYKWRLYNHIEWCSSECMLFL